MSIVAGLEVSHDRANRIYRWGFGIRRSMSARKREARLDLSKHSVRFKRVGFAEFYRLVDDVG